jgi:hypothetical protein
VVVSAGPSVLGEATTDTVPATCFGDLGPFPIAVAETTMTLANRPIAIALSSFRIVFPS